MTSQTQGLRRYDPFRDEGDLCQPGNQHRQPGAAVLNDHRATRFA